MRLLRTYTDYAIEILVINPESQWNKLSLHKTLEDARTVIEEYKTRSVILAKECKFRIVKLDITESEVSK